MSGSQTAVDVTWYGVSTFRLRVGATVLWLDAYLDRVPAAPPVGLSSRDVTLADAVLIGHSHFDHLFGAQTISDNTGARIVGSHETVRLMADAGVPDERLVAVGGGELLEFGHDIRVRVLPGLHSCAWAEEDPVDPAADQGLTSTERERRQNAVLASLAAAASPEVVAHLRSCGPWPRGDGGAHAYLIQTPAGTVFWADTSGYWTGIIRALRPRLAILAAAARGNVDGEPFPGPLADFVASEVELLQPRELLLCHHDDWMPPVTSPIDTGKVHRAVARRAPSVRIHQVPYGTPVTLSDAAEE
jgi:L-ascorbate metabolism protein UlaG (beta-lactamase superfamily)